MSLQEGIYHAPGRRPGRFFALLFLRAAPQAGAAQVATALADLWAMYAELKTGRVRDLEGVQLDVAAEDAMTVLLGFGRNAFVLEGGTAPRPRGLGDEYLFRSAEPGGGGSLLRGAGLAYASDVTANMATEHFCVQVIAETKLATDRAVVETWKALSDATAPALSVTTFYLGFQRNDGRSWIDFHDGVSNLRSEDREAVIRIDPGADEDWAVGGTYLAFLRLAVDLPAWRRLTRTDQELAVGREKLSGAPIVGIDVDGSPLGDPKDSREPPEVEDPRLRASHVQRANHHQRPSSDSGTRRIFRQGYEFLEWAHAAPGFRAGLNFVSFQDTPGRLLRMLTAEGWLGGANFGGDEERLTELATLLSVYGAGIYFVPPLAAGAAEPFPGAAAFGPAAEG